MPRKPTSKSVDEQCSLKDKRRKLVRQHATEEEIDDHGKEKNVGRDYSVLYDHQAKGWTRRKGTC